MSSRTNRTYIPSWTEVMFGAVLSVLLGIAVGAVLLVLRPVVVVRETPKGEKRDPKVVYYVQGLRDGSKGRQLLAKRDAFVGGQSVTVTEEELNTLTGPAPAAAPNAGSTQPDPKATNAAGGSDGFLAAGPLNFCLRDGMFQMSAPVTVNALGLSRQIVVQTRGSIVKKGTVFVYEPETIFAGSCPLQRLPFVVGFVRDRFLGAPPIPDEIKASWAKLASVSIQGNALKLTMP